MSNEPKPFLPRPHREHITREPDPAGRWSDKFPDMIGYRNQGGGKVPADFGWHTNPKQWQEELSPATLAEHHRNRVVPRARVTAPELPEGEPATSK
jgi:hypothetical protein